MLYSRFRPRRKVILFVLSYLLAAPEVLPAQFSDGGRKMFDACDFCLASQGISPLEVGSSGLRIDIRYLSVGTIFAGGTKTANPARELETHLTQQYSMFYAFDEALSIAALVPVPRRHSERIDAVGQTIVGNQFGVGDLAMLGRYKAFVGHDIASTFILSVQGGVKLPTGRTDGHDSHGDILDAHVQLGTGSTDALVGISAIAAVGRIAFIGNVLGSITGKGANSHQFGNSANYDATVRYRVWPGDYEETQLFLTFSLDGEFRGQEREDGAVDPNSGGHVVYASPGIQVFVTPAFSLEFSYQQAVLHNLYGQQLGEDYRLLSGVQILF